MMSNEQSSGAPVAQPANDPIANVEAMMSAMMASVNQRFSQIEEALQAQARTPSESMSEHPRTEPETTNTASPHIENDGNSKTSRNSEPVVASRPRATLPNQPMFGGSTSEWPAWQMQMENKLRVDGICFTSPLDQCAYIYSRLEKMALKNTTTFMRERRTNGTPEDLLTYLNRIYGDPNVEARAIQRLYTLKQKKNQSFEKFLPSFERELADAGALQSPDNAKKHTLLMALINRGIPTTFQGMLDTLHQISADLAGFYSVRASKRTHQSPVAEETYEPMDWTPTSAVRINRIAYESRSKQPQDEHLTGKRARWVNQEVINKRREEGLCLRCGRPNCRIASCPLKPARRPEEQEKRVNTVKTKRTHRNHTVLVKKSNRKGEPAVLESTS
ncbi:hypothetical protein N7532_010233 [Penicillium argentinense]|uniref:Retrotransposon gag domain-containing protein n=1 Tax=Penicillium argentinense TaxID=1131581 RepID=A0A9W9EP93_9EURO|nr:uncharacterized protein N7532_010233 [Penicillium argentinense]KAJ5085462.1 hypothetical protein N7532_010233 [Penicillium argentinense]